MGGETATKRPSIWRNHDVFAKSPGLLLREVDLGDRVSKGQRFGRILDGAGREASDVTSPVDGTVGLLRFHAGVRPGDMLARIWVPIPE